MLTTTFFVVFLTLGSFWAENDAKHLPKYIKKCRRSDPNLGACIKAQVEKLRPRLLKGIPEMRIPAYDPMVIPELALEEGSESIKFKALLHNVRLFGSKEAIIKDIKIDLDNLRLDIFLHFPIMRIKSNYEISGKVLVLPIVGKGHSDGNFTDLSTNVTFFGNYEYKNGTQYIKLMGRKVELNIEGCSLYFDNLFGGHRELSEATNKFINQNWKEIVTTLNPVIEETIASLVFQMVAHIFDDYPVNEILPP